jgi:hypothetical protein
MDVKVAFAIYPRDHIELHFAGLDTCTGCYERSFYQFCNYNIMKCFIRVIKLFKEYWIWLGMSGTLV